MLSSSSCNKTMPLSPPSSRHSVRPIKVGVAVVIAKPGASLQPEAIIAGLKARLANFKIPKKCFVVAELPRNTMGKVQKNLLREHYKDLFA